MKRFLATLLVCLLLATGSAVASDELEYSEAEVREDGTLVLETGMYEVGRNCSIPSGMYYVISQGFNGPVFIPGSNLILNEGKTYLRPSDTQSFHADGGTYIAGIDFPAGTYSIYSPSDSSSTIEIYDTDGNLVNAAFLKEATGERIGKCEILDGYTIVVDSAGCYFSAPSGITFE